MAEEVGFEPTAPCRASVFKTDAIGHSATLPERGILTDKGYKCKGLCTIAERFKKFTDNGDIGWI